MKSARGSASEQSDFWRAVVALTDRVLDLVLITVIVLTSAKLLGVQVVLVNLK